MLTWLAVALVRTPQNDSGAYGRFIDRISQAKSASLVETSRFTSSGKTTKRVSKFWFKKPNFCRMEDRNEAGELTYLIVQNDKVVWIWDPETKRLDKSGPFPGFFVHLFLLEPWEMGKAPEWIKESDSQVNSHLGEPGVIREHLKREGRSYKIVVDVNPQSSTPLHMVADRPNDGVRVEEFYSEMKFDGEIESSIFDYKPEVEAGSFKPLEFMLKPGSKAPDFKGTLLLSHKPFRLSSALKQHKATLVDVLMIGCVPCWDELKGDMAKLRKNYGPKGLDVIAVGLGNEQQIKMFLGDPKFTVPLVIGETCSLDVAGAYKTTVSASKYLIDSDGIIRARYVDADVATIQKDIDALLATASHHR